MDQAEAYSAVRNPLTPAAVIADIAYQFPQLRADVAAHPAAYPGLLEWLDTVGDPGVKAAVSARRAADEAKNPPWDNEPAELTVIKPLEPMAAPATQPAPVPVPAPATQPAQPYIPVVQSVDAGYSPAPVPVPMPTPVQPGYAPVPVPLDPGYAPAPVPLDPGYTMAPVPADPTSAPVAPVYGEQPEPGEPAKLTTGQKVLNGVYIGKCVIIGGIFTVGGIVYLFSGVEGNWFGILAILYGIWVLTGIKTGGWRLFIY